MANGLFDQNGKQLQAKQQAQNLVEFINNLPDKVKQQITCPSCGNTLFVKKGTLLKVEMKKGVQYVFMDKAYCDNCGKPLPDKP